MNFYYTYNDGENDYLFAFSDGFLIDTKVDTKSYFDNRWYRFVENITATVRLSNKRFDNKVVTITKEDFYKKLKKWRKEMSEKKIQGSLTL